MSRFKVILFLLFSLLPLNSQASDYDCSKSKNELNCVLKFYPKIYKKNPNYFWKIMNNSRDDALTCTSVHKTKDFLKIVNTKSKSVEFEEFLSEGVEKLCVTNPVCFNQSYYLLDRGTKFKVNKIIKNPVYYDINETSSCR